MKDRTKLIPDKQLYKLLKKAKKHTEKMAKNPKKFLNKDYIMDSVNLMRKILKIKNG